MTLIGPPIAIDRVVIARRERLALVELDAVDRGPALDEHVLVDARRLARDVLQHENVHAAIVARDPAGYPQPQEPPQQPPPPPDAYDGFDEAPCTANADS